MVPKLWSDTVDAHRASVREALLDTTARLIQAHGLASVTMSQIAESTGIGRATLYKYFPDIASILTAWHERQVSRHVAELSAIRDRPGEPGDRLEAVLMGFATIIHTRHDSALSAMLHHGHHVTDAQHQLSELVAELIGEAASAGSVRSDVNPVELASYCLHALRAASTATSSAAVERLVRVTTAGIAPPA